MTLISASMLNADYKLNHHFLILDAYKNYTNTKNETQDRCTKHTNERYLEKKFSSSQLIVLTAYNWQE